MNNTITAYPLCWPPGLLRTTADKRTRSKFHRKSNDQSGQFSFVRRAVVTLEQARAELGDELRMLGAKRVILSTNVERRNDGQPYSGRRPPDDPGAAVYFEHEGRKMAFACDRWVGVGENVLAIARTIAAIRGIERWGTGEMVAAAFTGFSARCELGDS